MRTAAASRTDTALDATKRPVDQDTLEMIYWFTKKIRAGENETNWRGHLCSWRTMARFCRAAYEQKRGSNADALLIMVGVAF